RIAFAVLAAGLLAVPSMAQGPYKYHAVTPCRLLDSRTACTTPNVPMGCGGPSFGVQNYAVQGKCGIPASGAGAVTLNATVVTPTGAGYLTMWPFSTTEPLVSTLNFLPGDSAIANGAIVPLFQVVNPGDNDLSVRIAAHAVNPNGTAFIVLDVTGYFSTN
ncbi:MAG: hypothetical protein ABI609_01030, partial [Acidobacteriota bacterium]